MHCLTPWWCGSFSLSGSSCSLSGSLSGSSSAMRSWQGWRGVGKGNPKCIGKPHF